MRNAAAIRILGDVMDNLLFLGGIVFSAIAVLAGAVYFLIYKIRSKKLGVMLDAEYGKKKPTPQNK